MKGHHALTFQLHANRNTTLETTGSADVAQFAAFSFGGVNFALASIATFKIGARFDTAPEEAPTQLACGHSAMQAVIWIATDGTLKYQRLPSSLLTRASTNVKPVVNGREKQGSLSEGSM